MMVAATDAALFVHFRKVWRFIVSHRMMRLSLILAGAVSLALAQGKPIPQLVKTGDKYNFQVDGKPLLVLGGQVNNPNAFPPGFDSAVDFQPVVGSDSTVSLPAQGAIYRVKLGRY